MSDVAANLPQSLAEKRQTTAGGLMARFRLLGRSNPLHIAFWLAQQHIVARAISGFAILLSALVFAPADFATFGIFLAVLNQTSLLLFLRYDALLISAETEADFCSAICLNLGMLALSLSTIAALSAICAMTGVITPVFAFLFVAALGFRGIQRILGGIATRSGAFRLIGQNSMIHAVSLPATILTAYCLDFNGAIAMAISDIVANILATAFLYRHLGYTIREATGEPNRARKALALAQDWSVLPRINLPAALLAMSFAQLPLMIIVVVAPPDVAGHVALLFRVMDFPVQLIMAASAPVLLNKLSKGAVRWLAMPIVIAALAGVVILVYGSIALGSFLIEPRITATAWSGISGMVVLVALFQGAIAFSSPLIDACSLYRRQTLLMTIHAAMLASVCIAFVMAPTWQMGLATVGFLAALRAVLVAARLMLLARQSPARPAFIQP
jgi:hypothetical protein